MILHLKLLIFVWAFYILGCNTERAKSPINKDLPKEQFDASNIQHDSSLYLNPLADFDSMYSAETARLSREYYTNEREILNKIDTKKLKRIRSLTLLHDTIFKLIDHSCNQIMTFTNHEIDSICFKEPITEGAHLGWGDDLIYEVELYSGKLKDFKPIDNAGHPHYIFHPFKVHCLAKGESFKKSIDPCFLSYFELPELYRIRVSFLIGIKEQKYVTSDWFYVFEEDQTQQ